MIPPLIQNNLVHNDVLIVGKNNDAIASVCTQFIIFLQKLPPSPEVTILKMRKKKENASESLLPLFLKKKKSPKNKMDQRNKSSD